MRHTGTLPMSRRCWTGCDLRASRSWLRRLKMRWRSAVPDTIRRRLREKSLRALGMAYLGFAMKEPGMFRTPFSVPPPVHPPDPTHTASMGLNRVNCIRWNARMPGAGRDFDPDRREAVPKLFRMGVRGGLGSAGWGQAYDSDAGICWSWPGLSPRYGVVGVCTGKWIRDPLVVSSLGDFGGRLRKRILFRSRHDHLASSVSLSRVERDVGRLQCAGA
jgi:hypothetical protein